MDFLLVGVTFSIYLMDFFFFDGFFFLFLFFCVCVPPTLPWYKELCVVYMIFDGN